MILHQDIRMQLNPIKLEVGGEDFKQFVPVRIIPEDIPSLVPPTGNVIPSSWIFYAKRSSHEVRIQNTNRLVNSSGLTPLLVLSSGLTPLLAGNSLLRGETRKPVDVPELFEFCHTLFIALFSGP
jgi:hypothetical protein